MTEDIDTGRGIAPDFRVIAIDESEYYDPEFLKNTGRIFCSYLYDKNEVTHLCSFTPSYCLYPLYNFSWEKSGEYDDGAREREDICEELIFGREDYQATYSDCSTVDSLEAQLKADRFRYHVLGDYGGRPDDSEETYRELVESVIEYCTCNWMVG